MPLPYDKLAPRKKYLLVKAIRIWNDRHPDKRISYVDVDGAQFNPDTEVIGPPARETLKAWQRAKGLDVSGQFNRATMKALIDVVNPQTGIRAEVMATAHEELGVHEWPPGSNRGEVLKYLKSCGIGVGAPWCAAFVTWVLKKEGFKKFPSNPAYVPTWHSWARQNGLLVPMHNSKLGDLWIWWKNQHIGFCDDSDPADHIALGLDGNVGANGGTVTQVRRGRGEVTAVISLAKLYKLG